MNYGTDRFYASDLFRRHRRSGCHSGDRRAGVARVVGSSANIQWVAYDIDSLDSARCRGCPRCGLHRVPRLFRLDRQQTRRRRKQ